MSFFKGFCAGATPENIRFHIYSSLKYQNSSYFHYIRRPKPFQCQKQTKNCIFQTFQDKKLKQLTNEEIGATIQWRKDDEKWLNFVQTAEKL